MNEIKLTWSEFEALMTRGTHKPHHSRPLFRGQKRASWPLKTTLERYTGLSDYSADNYYNAIRSAARAIETATGRRFEVESADSRIPPVFRLPDGYAFMAYLRQNGFPSPLLDWTRSPYVAAFFAFHCADCREEDSVAIFEYVEFSGSGKTSDRVGTIHSLGPWIATDRKHLLQQSEYTVCRTDEKNHVKYVSHDPVFAKGHETQDILTKYILPAVDKTQVMRRLSVMNINAYALFETTQGLMELLANDVIGEPLSGQETGIPPPLEPPSVQCINGVPFEQFFGRALFAPSSDSKASDPFALP